MDEMNPSQLREILQDEEQKQQRRQCFLQEAHEVLERFEQYLYEEGYLMRIIEEGIKALQNTPMDNLTEEAVKHVTKNNFALAYAHHLVSVWGKFEATIDDYNNLSVPGYTYCIEKRKNG